MKIKQKTKTRILVIGFTIFFLFFFLINGNNVKGDDNYSNYLFQQEINVYNDKAMILNELSTSSNNYRNYFDSGFIFPAKLSSEMFNAYATSYTQYSLSQIYLDNLDNDYAFKSNNLNENLYTYQDIEIEQTDIINGSFSEVENEINIVKGSDDYYNYGWNKYLHPSFVYALYNDDTNIISTDIINSSCIFDLENITDIGYYIQNITIMIDIYSSTTNGNRVTFRINQDNWFETKNISCLYQTWQQVFIYYNNINISINDFNNLQLNLLSHESISYYTEIDQIKIYIYLTYNNTVIKSQNIENTLSFSDNFNDDSIGSEWIKDNNNGVITENDNVLKLSADSTCDWYGGVYNAPKIYYNISNFLSLEYILKVSNPYPTTIYSKHQYGLLLYENDANAWFFGYDADTSQKLIIAKIISDTLSTITSISYNNYDYIRIYKNSTHFSFQYSVDDIDYNTLYTITSLGINLIYAGLYHKCWYGSSYTVYFDDFSISDISFYSEFNYSTEVQINFLESNIYTPVFLDLGYELWLNTSEIIYFSIYNYDLEYYLIFDLISNIFYCELNYFRFNESSMYRFNKFKINLYGISNTQNFLTFIKNFYLRITYVHINNEGYHDLSVKIDKQTDGSVYKGYFLFHLKIYNNTIYYQYTEYNTDTDNYQTNWLIYEFESISSLELNIHCRYGLNTLDIEISNILARVYIDGIEGFSLLEQDRKFFDGKHYRPEFNYTCNNRNYLNLTGVVGNYSYNCLKGIRCLAGENNQVYNRFFIVPLFQEQISVSQRIVTQGTIEIENEPEMPKGASYWTYETFRLVGGNPYSTEVGNWSVDFAPVIVQKYTAKYPYNPESYKKTQFGDWTFKIGSWKVSINFIRDAFCKIVNLILLFFQFIGFFIVAACSYIFMFLGCYILAFLYNVCVYYIYIGLCYVVWFLWVALLWLYEVVIWIWSNLIYPFLQWVFDVLLPLIIDAIIIIIAFMLTVFIYILTLGQIDFWSLYYQIYDILWLIVDFIIDWFTIFITHYDALLIFLILYLLTIALIWFNYAYSRARGFKTRAERMFYTFEIFIAPIIFIWNLIIKLLEGTPEA